MLSCFMQSMTTVILRARLIPTHFVRREFSPPIIRDRAGAIRPDFSMCVESSCTLVGRTLSVIVAFLFCSLLGSGKGVGGLSFGLLGRQIAAISGGVCFICWD